MGDLNVKQKELDTSLVIKDDVIKYIAADVIDEKDLQRLVDIGDQVLDKNITSSVLIDINGVDRFSLKDRGCWTQFLKNIHIKKTAILGGDRFSRTVASFIVTASGADNASFFTEEEEALEWLHV